MADVNHTPGPWAVGSVDGRVWVTGPDANAPVICDVVSRRDRGNNECATREDWVNARLIAAAPALLAAARAVVAERIGRAVPLTAAERELDSAIRETEARSC